MTATLTRPRRVKHDEVLDMIRARLPFRGSNISGGAPAQVGLDPMVHDYTNPTGSYSRGERVQRWQEDLRVHGLPTYVVRSFGCVWLWTVPSIPPSSEGYDRLVYVPDYAGSVEHEVKFGFRWLTGSRLDAYLSTF